MHYKTSISVMPVVTMQEGWKISTLQFQMGRYSFYVGNPAAGKTTLTRLINGLIPNYYEGKLTGNVLLNGKNISQLPLYETAKYVGSVFQNPRTQFFTVDSTSELAFGCENQGLPENEIVERVKFIADQFDIESLMGKNIFCMSGGEKQKIACASVSVSDPPIMVLDEPSSNLDISATEDLRRMIQLWKEQGKTVVIAEHRLYYLRDLIDRVLYLEDGKIEKDYSASEALALSAEQQIQMGLRPFNIFEFPISIRALTDQRDLYARTFILLIRGSMMLSILILSHYHKAVLLPSLGIMGPENPLSPVAFVD